MQIEHVISQLVGDLRPVRRRTAGRDGLLLLLLLGIELAMVFALGAIRTDMPAAVATMSFWWKLVSLGAIAALGVGLTLLSQDPARSPRHGLRWMLPIAAASLAAGWGIDAAHDGWPALVQRIDWPTGVECVVHIVALSLPVVAALGLLMRRGAPTDTNACALAAGLAAAAWGAFVFVFSCPYDDPLYVVVWYGLGCGVVTAAAQLALPRLIRW